MHVEIWWDPVCPWCYLGKAAFEAAFDRVERPERIRVTWRAFQLDPDASTEPGPATVDVMAEHELDRHRAHHLGITGVPTFVIDGETADLAEVKRRFRLRLTGRSGRGRVPVPGETARSVRESFRCGRA